MGQWSGWQQEGYNFKTKSLILKFIFQQFFCHPLNATGIPRFRLTSSAAPHVFGFRQASSWRTVLVIGCFSCFFSNEFLWPIIADKKRDEPIRIQSKCMTGAKHGKGRENAHMQANYDWVWEKLCCGKHFLWMLILLSFREFFNPENIGIRPRGGPSERDGYVWERNCLGLKERILTDFS